jgi:hypothetical protein
MAGNNLDEELAMTALWIMLGFSIGTVAGFGLFAILQISREIVPAQRTTESIQRTARATNS